MGAPTRYLALGAETGESYCLSLGVSAVGGSTPPHRHDFEEGFYLVSGEVTFTAGNQDYRLGKGDFINIGANAAHRIKNESGEPAELLTLCAPAGFDRFQIDGGYLMDGPDGKLVPMSDEVKQRLQEAAEGHQIDLNPPPEVFEQKPERVTVVRASEGELIDAVGDRYRFLAKSGDTANQYALWEALLTPGGGPPPHTHDREEEAFYILEGEITFYTSGSSFQATAGDSVHLPRRREHRFRNEGKNLARTLIIVAPGGLEEMFARTGHAVTDAASAVAHPNADELELLKTIAPDYGIQLDLS